ncbi:MAG: hypothetical protein ACXVZ3_04090 [Gaiellaceae bacterium]
MRCRGFEKGNSVALKHGSYALLRLQPRATELAPELLELVPLSSPTDGPAIEALAMILAQAEHAGLVLATVQARTWERITRGEEPLTADERDDLRRLSADLRGWLNSAGRFFEMLGMTPSSRARLGLDIAQTQRTISLIDYYRDRDEDGELTA